jgi:predicted acyltransferase
MTQRYYSLDVFRGATVCLMILVNNPGTWSHIFDPLEHAPWNGLTPTDLVFPFFLFAVGNALSFVMPKLEADGDAAFWKKILKRTALIFLIGLFLNWWPFVKWSDGELVFRNWVDPVNPESGVRIFGVLQRIALCYFFASVIIYYLKSRKAFLAALILLLLYWILCITGNSSDPYSLSGWFGTVIDKNIVGVAHMYKGEGMPFDPEGLMSTIPAIVQVIFGYLIGDYIQKKSLAPDKQQFDIEKQSVPVSGPHQMLNGMFVIGIAMLITGYCWNMVFPVNKKIWTSSYTVATTGLAILTIGVMIYMIELKNKRGWFAGFFDVFGKNALFVFALSAFLPKGLALIKLGDGVTPWNFLFKKLFIHVLPGKPEVGSLLFALTVITFMWLICYWMDKKKIYIKV